MSEEDLGGEESVDYGVRFRAYIPRDKKLQPLQTALPDASRELIEAVEQRVSELTQPNRHQDVLGLAPKKAAWDLQRDLQPKLAQLDKDTQQALVGLLKRQKVDALEEPARTNVSRMLEAP